MVLFGKFPKICHENYGFYPCYFVTDPSLSWNVLLKMTGLKIERLSCIEMYVFVVKGMQGGISYDTTMKIKKKKKL